MDYLLTVLIFGLLLLFVARMDRVAMQASAGRAQVHDGDTVTIDGQRMRLRGIDAPEYNQTCEADARDYPCGREARRALAALADGKGVTCEGWERDRYMRLLVVCRAGDVDLNAEMVRLGWAVSYGDYRREEADARARKVGLWRGTFDMPREWRVQHQPQQPEPPHDWAGTLLNWLRQLMLPGS